MRVSAIVQDPASINQISNLAILETQSAFAMKVRTGALDKADAGIARDKVFRDVAARVFFAVRLEASHIDDARGLVGKYGYRRKLKTLDALQLAVALELRGRNLLDIFVVADKLLAEIAAEEGLVVLNPEEIP